MIRGRGRSSFGSIEERRSVVEVLDKNLQI